MVKVSLSQARKVYLDTAIYIYLFEENREFFKISSRLFKTLIQKRKMIVSSTLTLAELLRKREIQINAKVKEEIKEKFLAVPNFQLVDLDLFIAEHSAALTARYNLSLPDGIHLATAILTNCDFFISNDKKLKKVREIKIVYLDDLGKGLFDI